MGKEIKAPANAAAVAGVASGAFGYYAVAAGGQAGTSTRIENYLGFPGGISGMELAERATLQAGKFGARLVVPAEASGFCGHEDHYRVRLTDEQTAALRARADKEGRSMQQIAVSAVEDYLLRAEDALDFNGHSVRICSTRAITR